MLGGEGRKGGGNEGRVRTGKEEQKGVVDLGIENIFASGSLRTAVY